MISESLQAIWGGPRIAQRGLIGALVGGGGVEGGQMVDDDAQMGHCIADAQRALQQGDVLIGGFQHQIGIGQTPQPIKEGRFARAGGQIVIPQIAVADAAKQRIGVEAGQQFREISVFGAQIADHAQDDRIAGGLIEHPLIVLHQRAGLDHDGADDAQRFGMLRIGGGERAGAVRGGFSGPA